MTITVNLTNRERQVLTLLAEGYTQTEVAVELGLSHPTVKRFIEIVLVRLNAMNTTNAVAIAIRHGLL